MKHLIAAACLVVAGAGTAMADPVHGTWQTETGETGGYLHVTIAACGDSICGTIAKVVNNDNTSIKGKRMIWDMEAKGDGSYSGGKIWAPDRDKVYSSKMSLSGNNLEVSGCVLVVCRAQSWTKVQ